jgi:hypothetical protein
MVEVFDVGAPKRRALFLKARDKSSTFLGVFALLEMAFLRLPSGRRFGEMRSRFSVRG